MAGYSIKLPKELKESLASEFDGNWDSDDNNELGGVESADNAPPRSAAEDNNDGPSRQNHGSVSSESSQEGSSNTKDGEDKERKSIGSRLKRVFSSEAKLPKTSDQAKHGTR